MQYQIFNLDCRDVMSLYLEDNSVDAIVTDPPYELSNDGKQSPNRVFFEFAFPQNSKVEAHFCGGNCLSDLVSEILCLSGVWAVPRPTPAVPVDSVTLDDYSSFGNNDVINASKSPVTVAQVAASTDIESERCKHLGSFALKLADTTKFFQILDKLGSGFYSGAIGVGFGECASSFPGFQHRSPPVENGSENIGIDNDTLSNLIGTLGRATSGPMFSFQLARGSAENFTTDGARLFAAILLLSGAQIIRTRPATSGLPTMLESRRICIVNDATNRAISLDILVHPQSISSSGFMGNKWDGSKVAYDVALWKEMLRVLKPGGHLLSFGGSRTYHRMASAVEDAGFEIRDQIMWVYGCLDEQTQIATADGVKPYHKTKIGDSVLCYNPCSNEYSYQPILDIVEYDYSDTAYRLVGDFGEQVVSRNHRVIIERCGKEVFEFAENIALEQQAHVPILESLSELQQAIRNAQQDASCPQQDLQQRMCECTNRHSEQPDDTVGATQRRNDKVFGLQQGSVETECLVKEGINPSLQPKVQRYASRKGMGDTCIQREVELETGIGGCIQEAHDGGNKPVMERWVDLPEPQGCVCGSTDKICSVPHGVSADGKDGRVRDGASPSCGNRSCTDADANRSCASHKPQCNGQPDSQSDAICNEHTPQVVRAWGGHRTSLVRIVPFRYTGKVWCLRVPTGAFVAVRNGVAFPTGNSGFPKSLNVSKAIDNAAGHERATEYEPNYKNGTFGKGMGGGKHGAQSDPPVTEAARQWQGWGTSLKPAHEPLVLARKPLIGTVAANVLAHGTGGLNIDECRVETTDDLNGGAYSNGSKDLSAASSYATGVNAGVFVQPSGRWPANLIHDGSDEVVSCFPESASGSGGRRETSRSSSFSIVKCGPVNIGAFTPYADAGKGSAARFFYAAKASNKDREDGNAHPTVKPTDLMAYLCRLVTPAGGVVLDPFMGSGSTGKAAIKEGFRFIGAEREAAYYAIAEARLKAAAV